MKPLPALAALFALACAMPSTAEAAPAPVQFSVAFVAGAHLGRDSPMIVNLRVSLRLGPVTEFRLLTPPGLSLADSRLGAAECRRPLAEAIQVMGPIHHRRCPANSLLGIGSATAGLLLSEEQTLVGTAVIELHAGAPVGDRPGLLVTADTYHPARMQLTYAGYLYAAPAPFGLGMALMIPAIPHPPFGAAVALSTLRLAVGASSIRYRRVSRGRRVWYRPGGVPLPESCPPGGFRFRAILRFADSTRRSVDALAPCPARRP